MPGPMNRSLRGGSTVKHGKKTFARLFKEVFRGNALKLAVVLVCILVSSMVTVFVSNMIETLIDSYITPLITGSMTDFGQLAKAIVMWAAVMATGVLSVFIYSRIMVTIAQDALMNIRNKMFEKLEHLPISYYDQTQHGATMSLFTNDADTLQQMISQSLVGVVSSLLTVIMVFSAMLANSWRLTIVVVAATVVMFDVTKVVAGKSSRNFVAQQANLARVNGFIEEMINGSKVVKVFCHENESEKDFDVINEALCQTMTKAGGYSNVMGPITMNIGNLQYVLLVFIGSAICLMGGGFAAGYTVGMLAAFLQLSRSFANPISQISQQANFVLQALAGAERIFEFLDRENETDNGYVTLVNSTTDENGNVTESSSRTGSWAWKHPHTDGSPVTYTPLAGDIEMHEVDFGYTQDKTVLHDITLYAKPGQKIAFVGSTGAGKTTITNLLNRFYDIQDGKIRFDGININKIRKADLRRSLGMILQDTSLFTGTIRDNIRFGKLDATDEEIEKAARLANAHDFIMMMPDGYDTMLENNGENLSQGQRQLLSIARAAVADPPVLVMDEATSSIDTYTERLVQDGMDKLMANRTVFVIAHRLSTVRNSNAIMVLDHGRIIERGDHDDLMAQKGTYYRLCTGETELE